MSERSKEDKKALLKKWKATQNKKYILSKIMVRNLFHYLESQLSETSCDNTLHFTALLLECKVNGSIPLGQLRDDADDRTVTITATRGEQNAMNKALADFSADPLAYALHDMVPDEDMKEMARDRRLRLWKALIKLGREKLSQ